MARKPVSVHAAKTHLSRLIERALAGEEVIITRGKQPVVKLVAIRHEPARRKFGAMKGRATVGDAFFEPLSPEELEQWGT